MMRDPAVGVLLIHGVGRHKVDHIVLPFEARLAELGLSAEVRCVIWSDLTETQLPTEDPFASAGHLWRAIKNMAHLPTARHPAAASRPWELPWRMSGAL